MVGMALRQATGVTGWWKPVPKGFLDQVQVSQGSHNADGLKIWCSAAMQLGNDKIR